MVRASAERRHSKGQQQSYDPNRFAKVLLSKLLNRKLLAGTHDGNQCTIPLALAYLFGARIAPAKSAASVRAACM